MGEEKKQPDWKKEPATEKQLGYIFVLLNKVGFTQEAKVLSLFGLDRGQLKSITKGQAHALIERLKLSLSPNPLPSEPPEPVYPYYVVFSGKEPGIYESLKAAKRGGPDYQGFASLAEAQQAFAGFSDLFDHE